MRLALLGGTFDPIHHGHLELARRAAQRFDLKRVYFVPAFIPPHKPRGQPTAFEHRFAMVALATLPEKTFVPSLLEAPWSSDALPSALRRHRPAHAHAPHQDDHGQSGASYSIDTVRRLRRTLKKSDRLFFLIGIDAFLEIASWKEPEALLAECEFIVASRPGYTLADVANALPKSLRPSRSVTRVFTGQAAAGEIVLRGVQIHLLEGLNVPVSATQVRQAAAAGRRLDRLVPAPVADYIKKMRLYVHSRVPAARGEM